MTLGHKKRVTKTGTYIRGIHNNKYGNLQKAHLDSNRTANLQTEAEKKKIF